MTKKPNKSIIPVEGEERKINTTRDRKTNEVRCEWKDFLISFDGKNKLYFSFKDFYGTDIWFPKQEIPNLIKALKEIIKEK